MVTTRRARCLTLPKCKIPQGWRAFLVQRKLLQANCGREIIWRKFPESIAIIPTRGPPRPRAQHQSSLPSSNSRCILCSLLYRLKTQPVRAKHSDKQSKMRTVTIQALNYVSLIRRGEPSRTATPSINRRGKSSKSHNNL